MTDPFRYVLAGLMAIISFLLGILGFWFKRLDSDMATVKKELHEHREKVASDYVTRAEAVGRIEDVKKSVDGLSLDVKQLTKAIYQHIGKDSTKE